MSQQLSISPHPALAENAALLAGQLAQVAARLGPDNFASLLDPLLGDVFDRGIHGVSADEGILWLLDGAQENLVPSYHTGPDAARIVGKFKQPLSSGLIGMVFATEQPFLENDIPRNPSQNRSLDQLLGVETRAMIAVPFHCLKGCRGVISCVHLRPARSPGPRAPGPGPETAGFSPANLADVQRLAVVLAQLLEYKLVRQVTGWNLD